MKVSRQTDVVVKDQPQNKTEMFQCFSFWAGHLFLRSCKLWIWFRHKLKAKVHIRDYHAAGRILKMRETFSCGTPGNFFLFCMMHPLTLPSEIDTQKSPRFHEENANMRILPSLQEQRWRNVKAKEVGLWCPKKSCLCFSDRNFFDLRYNSDWLMKVLRVLDFLS